MSEAALHLRLQRHRVLIGRVLTPLVLIYLFGIERIPVHPLASRWGLAGAAVVLLGVAIRSLSAGVLHKNEQLASDGIYAVVRNPLYLGSLVMLVGVNLVIGDWVFLAASAAIFALTHIPAILNEERGLANRYGAEWNAYSAATPRLLPRLSRLGALGATRWSARRWYENHEHNTVFAAVALLALLEIYSRFTAA